MKRRYIFWVALILAAIFLSSLLFPRIDQFMAARTQAKARISVAQTNEQNQEDNAANPVDFNALKKGNSDIYAWLYVPDAEINEPILQNSEDSQYYLTHNSVGSMDDSGALFTESTYNSLDFSDPATVIYGKNTRSGRLFSNLQSSFSSSAELSENGQVIVYLPDKEIHYTVFAAVPFRSYHILHYFSFKNPERYQMFLEIVQSIRTVDAYWNSAVEVTPEDQLLILSTTRSGNSNMCYLVLAKRI